MALFYIHHTTHYQYAGPVVDSANQIKLYPVQDERQRVFQHVLTVSPHVPEIITLEDYFGNRTGFYTYVLPHEQMKIDNSFSVEIWPVVLPARGEADWCWRALHSEESRLQKHDFLLAEQVKAESEIRSMVAERVREDEHPVESILRLSDYIFEHFTYRKGVTSIETEVDELWALRAGVCQDFAHLLLYMLRSVDIPSRYISGYICPGTSEWRGEGATHAWVEAWLPDLGWVGIDPTNKCLAGDRHVRLAHGRNFSDCTPVKGTYRGATEHTLEVAVHFSTEPFSARDRQQHKPTFVAQVTPQDTPRNSFAFYMQMQQQQ